MGMASGMLLVRNGQNTGGGLAFSKGLVEQVQRRRAGEEISQNFVW